MDVWEVLAQRTEGDDFVPVGAVNAPDLEFAMLLAEQAYLRHKEGVNFAVRRRGDGDLHVCPEPGAIGGVTDRSYRRQEGYVGVGAKLRRIREEMAGRGLVIDRPRPPSHERDSSEATHG
jgi:1,2-phenylacetyl-CoA epoxidase PaaB subunit